jgi:ABC-type cobalamin transport system ATPase subunit
MTEEETIKLAEKLLIASYGAQWGSGHTAESLTEHALEQAYSFRDEVNKRKEEAETQQNP